MYNEEKAKDLIKELVSFLIGEKRGKGLTVSKQELEFIKYHKLEGVLYDYLNYYEQLHMEQLAEIMNITEKNTAINKRYCEIQEELDQIFVENEIKYVVLKGVALNNILYPKPYYRQYSDLDILISLKDIHKVEKILLEYGFEYGGIREGKVFKAERNQILFQKLYTHELHNMIKKIDGEIYNIDVNFKFSWNGIKNDLEYMEEIDCEELLIEKNIIRIGTIVTLRKEYQFIHLCCHLYNEAMFFALDREYKGGDPQEIRLIRILDIILLLQEELNLDEIKAIMNKQKCEYKIKYALELIANFYELHKKYKQLYVSKFNSRIDYYYDEKGNRKKWNISLDERLFNMEYRKQLSIGSKRSGQI